MKLSDHNLLSLRCAMTELGYRWRGDPEDRSALWRNTNHWDVWPALAGGEGQELALYPIVSCGGDLYTGDVACMARLNPDRTLSDWYLTESYSGTWIELDARIHRLEDLPGVLGRWVLSWSEVER